MKKFFLLAVLIGALSLFAGCGDGDDSPLDPNNPVEIMLWHYYTGALLSALDMMVLDFNRTVGLERGISVEAVGFGNMGVLDANLRASLADEAGSSPLPNIFSAFPDTAYVPQQMGLLVDLDDFFSPAQLEKYFQPFVERGRMGLNNELRIFPVAMSGEIMLVNETAWLDFANETGFTLDDLLTMERLVEVAGAYYAWSGGRAFWGRDAIANMFIIGSKMFGTEIFEIFQADGEVRAAININPTAMRRFWDFYYTPFISGYFNAYANFRTDDLRVGHIIAFVGSSASAAFFPADITIDGEVYPIQGMALPPPGFEGVPDVVVKQGAGKAVMASSPEEEYAAATFIAWLTEPEQNLLFSAASGRMPVLNDAMDVNRIRAAAEDAGIDMTDITYQTLRVAIESTRTSNLYSTCAFIGAADARSVLTESLRHRALAGRNYVLEQVAAGAVREEIIAQLSSDERFYIWIEELEIALAETVS
ncbi:MAG: extracellular solute-binding protein [Defluviitaleaceae bacterium]|nr:extracellular solute-binding protein [Defluviitaleaceae bacterium]